MDIQHMRAILHFIGLLILITKFSNGQSVTLTGPSLIQQGTDTVYTCTGGAAPYTFIWEDLSVIPIVNIFINGKAVTNPSTHPKYVNFGVSENEGTSTMTITNTLVEDEGQYKCVELPVGTGNIDGAELTVEVKSIRNLSVKTITESNVDVFEAICEALGGRPDETITWMLDDGPSPCDDTNVTYPAAGEGLSSTRSVCTFQADNENIGQTLKCVISGHQVSDLNGEKTTTLNMQNPTLCTCVPSGLYSGASAGIAVLAILLVGSVIINIIQFIMLRRHETRPGFEESSKTVSREERHVSHEANDNTAYEMIQNGDRAYTSLKLGPSHSPIIAPENVTFFTRLGSIGRGDFGGVWKGELRSNQSQVDVAIRQIPDQVTNSTNVLQAVKVLSELSDQPNVVKCLGYCQEQGGILYEFIPGGTLLTHLQTTGVQSQPTYGNLKPKRVRIDEGSLLNLAWQIAKGMQYLASKKIIHGTLCAHNVLLGDRKQCKLSDYGLSSSLFSNAGKPTRWSSPETMVTGDQSTEGDSWSFGIVLWEIVTLGAMPYPKKTIDTVQKEVANGYQMPCPLHCGQEVYSVMSGCWEKEATRRSNFDQILKSLERILEKTHNYLSLNDLDEGLYASTLDM